MGKARDAERKKQRSGVKEIVFDPNARREFINGFRKRKNERRQFARQKIAGEVRQEKIKARQEKRDHMKELRAVGLGAGDEDEEEEEADDGEEEAEAANAELTSFLFGGTLTTTVVTPMIDEPAADAKPAADDPIRTSQPDLRPKKKKFNLSLPLATAIPGYKAPEGLKKKNKKKGKKKGVVSKKEKARNRAPRRDG